MLIIGFVAFVRSEPYLFCGKWFWFFGLSVGMNYRILGNLSVSWSGEFNSPLQEWMVF